MKEVQGVKMRWKAQRQFNRRIQGFEGWGDEFQWITVVNSCY